MERRACQRKIKKLTTLFITGNKEYQGITSDISCNGIFLRTSKNLQKGTTLDMKVEYNNSSSMSLTGKVVREAFTLNNQGLGIQLINISPEYDDLVKELHPKIMANEWETIFNAIGQPAIILDADHKIIEANKATLTASGMSKKDFLGKKCHDIFHKTSEPPKMCPMSKAFQSRKPETKTMELETLGGVYLVSCTPIFDKEGCLEKIIHIATDITERKKIEDALMESEKKMQVLSITDELTGLSNRRGFFTLAEQQLKQSI